MTNQAGEHKFSILIIDDDPLIVSSLTLDLKLTYTLHTAANLTQAREILEKESVEAVLLDLHFSESSVSGIDFISEIKKIQPRAEIVILTGNRDSDTIIKSLKKGASDYITKPFEINDIELTLEKACCRASFRKGQEQVPLLNQYPEFVGRSKATQMIRAKIDKCAQSTANILIVGESGTGKEVLSRHLHRLKDHGNRPFVTLNCAAIPAELLESILFGHEKGSFTGALQRRVGKFEQADGGDIFLDEIGSMPMSMQAKLLRVLQEKEFERIGSSSPIASNFRVISATNRDLRDQIQEGTFREDLYYRLSVVQLHIPPLRERREDIPLLISFYLENSEQNIHQKMIDPKARAMLTQYEWPGNIRQLFNVLDSMTILGHETTLTTRDIPTHLLTPSSQQTQPNSEHDFLQALDEYETQWILAALQKTHGNKEKASKHLKISRSSLIRRMKRLNMMDS
ncbi:MAG: sigma-54-dependent Fis family transcriptional regulator [Bdellovibrionales bacterium]|nr:sigma-54-dependent Fis family transcriptional regulator [Bdellovibrionales bacterium]